MATIALLWLTVLAFASPINATALPSGPHASGAPLAGAGGHVLPAGAGTSRTVPAPSPVRIPGLDPAGQATIDPAAFAASHPVDRDNLLVNWSLAGIDPVKAAAEFHTALGTSSSASPESPQVAHAVTLPLATATPTGTVAGIVESSATHTPLVGVQVQAYSATGLSNCAIKICGPSSSSSNGSFSVTAPVGADYVQFMLSYNLTNITYCTVYQSLTTNVGIVYMVPEAFITGIVEANTSTHPRLPGVLVTSTSDDNTVTGNPAGATNSLGEFTAALPPVPSTVSFSPPFGYESTFIFEDAAPGQHLNLGTILVQKDPVVKVEVYDSVTGKPVSGACSFFNAQQCNSITVCSAVTPSLCGTQSTAVGSSTVEAVGPAGQDLVKVWSTYYETNVVYIGNVPYNSGVFDAGKVYLTPMGYGTLAPELTKNVSSKLPAMTTGQVWMSICSMDGQTFGDPVFNPTTLTINVTSTGCNGRCTNINVPFTFQATPLSVLIRISPDTQALCAPTPQWPINPELPVYQNSTVINVTPDENTVFYANLSIGDYVAGNVTVAHGAVPSDFTVTPIPIDNPTLTTYPFVKQAQGTAPCATYFPWDTGADAFCVAVPPGASELKVSTSQSAFEQNITWGSAPTMCCTGHYPETLAQYTTDRETSINLTMLGDVHGKVAAAGTGAPVFFASYSIQSAGTSASTQIFSGAVALNGTIYSAAPLGWDSVTISASGYASNTVWVNVTSNQSFGTVPLTLLATVAGRVVDPSGIGIIGASVYYCSFVAATTCQKPLGAGLATTGGGYNGTVPGLRLPYTTYEIYASASGFLPDWTWVNATAGNVSLAAPIVLYPATTSLGPAHAGARTSSSSAGTYLTGYLVDASTGQGVVAGSSSLNACSTATGVCYSMQPGTNSQGQFNSTVPLGIYNFDVTVPGYAAAVRYVNASGGVLQNLGVIPLYPLPWVHGVATTSPLYYVQVTVPGSTNVVSIAIVPGANAMACTANSSTCGAALPISSNGSFTVAAPVGTYDHVTVQPVGGGGPTTNTGFTSNQSVFNGTANTTVVLNSPIVLAQDAIIGGSVLDNSTTGPGGVTPWLGVPGAAVVVATLGPSHTSFAWSTNLAGQYVMFVPPISNNRVFVSSGITGVFTTAVGNLTATLSATAPPTVTQMPVIELTHYGWIQAQVTGSNGTPAAFLTASTVLVNGTGGEQGSGETNAAGHLNATAPPGTMVTLTLGPGNDYNVTTLSVSVNASATTYPKGGSALHLGLLTAASWGWALSASTNSTYVLSGLTVVDQVNGFAIPDVSVQSSSSDGLYAGTAVTTNWQGQYVEDAPIGGADTLLYQRAAAVSNTTSISVSAGQTRVQSQVHLTGVGVLAGVVTAYPSGTPVSGATVQTCPYTVSVSYNAAHCYTATTNATGQYWVAAYPGLVTLQASAPGYASNTTGVATACSDCWTSVGPTVLNQFAYIAGTVRGLPSGLPLLDASVSLCAPVGGNPIGICDFTVLTDASGNFVLEAPAGSYNLYVNTTGYNASVPLPVTLKPGQELPVGTVFLEQYGTAAGTVLSETTYLGVENASIYPCESWAGGSCLPTIQANSAGAFLIAGPPGTYTTTVSAAGYLTAFVTVTIQAGVVRQLSPIFLVPQGTATNFVVTGNVVEGSTHVGIAGANVIAEVNGSPEYTATTNAAGQFSLSVEYGTYTLVAAAPGYAPASQPIVAHAPVQGLVFSLSVMQYRFSTAITDGLTGSPLPGAQITENGSLLATTDVSGLASFLVANGTHELTAADPASATAPYAPVTFAVFVSGSAVVHNVQLDPPIATIHGAVVDADSGAALSGATVTITGATVDGVPVHLKMVTDGHGAFTASLTDGTYSASGSAPGYASTVASFSASGLGTSVSLLLTPLAPASSTHAPAASTSALEWAVVGLVVVVGALAVLTAVTWVRRRSGGGGRRS